MIDPVVGSSETNIAGNSSNGNCRRGLDFQGQRVHVVQIGLGTNSTVIQNLAGAWHEWCSSISWLMDSISERRRSELRGIAVEPVKKLLSAHWDSAQDLPYMELVQVAMSEVDSDGANVMSFDPDAADALVLNAPWHKRDELRNKLEYILNMSCVGKVHHMIPSLTSNFAQEFKVKLEMAETPGRSSHARKYTRAPCMHVLSF